MSKVVEWILALWFLGITIQCFEIESRDLKSNFRSWKSPIKKASSLLQRFKRGYFLQYKNDKSRDLDRFGEFRHDRYHTYEEIKEYIENLEKQYPALIKVTSLGNSYEGRSIPLVKIGIGDDSKKPGIWLDGGIHSNEWIGPATLLYFISQLTEGADWDGEIRWLLSTFTWYILPVFNVDGYVYTWTNDRAWRKSRSHHNKNNSCIGVDMNRNWDVNWGGADAVLDPCGINYVGPHAFSEPEVVAVTNFLSLHNDVIKAYFAFHSYGQMWMVPYSYTKDKDPPNIKTLLDISEKSTKAIEHVRGTHYQYGKISNLIAEISGSSVDYVYSNLNVSYSFGIELPDEGAKGILLPSSDIIPIAEEMWAGVRRFSRILFDQYKTTDNANQLFMALRESQNGD